MPGGSRLKIKKRIVLDLDHQETLVQVGKALSSGIRLNILKLLIEKSANISEIANTFDIPCPRRLSMSRSSKRRT